MLVDLVKRMSVQHLHKQTNVQLEAGAVASQQTFVGLQDMSWRCLQQVFGVTILRLPRRLEGVFKTSWKTKNCYAEDVLKTSSRHVFKTSWRRLEDQQMFAGLLLVTIRRLNKFKLEDMWPFKIDWFKLALGNKDLMKLKQNSGTTLFFFSNLPCKPQADWFKNLRITLILRQFQADTIKALLF